MCKFFKKSIAAILISISVFSSVGFAYDDVPADYPNFYAIEYLRRNDVFQSSKLFKPELLISRAEFIKYLVLLNSPKYKPGKNIKLPFTDIKNSSWYAPYFDEAIKLGILNSDKKAIYPEKKITVAEAVELIFNSKSIPKPRKYVGPIPYKDVEKSKDMQALMMRAVELGVATPEKPDYLGMFTKISRAKAAQMIYKMDLVDLRDPQMFGTQSYEPALKKIMDTWTIINSDYADKETIDSTKLSDSAIKAMVDSLGDPYSVYMDAMANQNFSDELIGQFEGIGAYIGLDANNRIAIIAPIKDSPAYKAGVKSGDIVKKVDDFSAEGATVNDIVSHIKGPKGSTVKLSLERNGEIIEISVIRDVINVASIEYKVIGNDNIMHIRLVNFGQFTLKDFQDVADIVRNNTKIKGIILDMRDNPGGFLDVAVGILNYVLPMNSTAVKIQYGSFNLDQVTTSEGVLKDIPLVVLVNKGSASASEIVAGALQDYGRAKIIGETTFGKGTVQEINYFNDDSSLKLTVAKWLTPKGNSIQKNGIKPDLEVVQGADTNTDAQLNVAIQEVNKLIH